MCVSFDLVRPENYKMKRTFEPLFPRPIIDRYRAPLSLSLSRPRFFLSLFLFSEKKKEKLEIEQDRRARNTRLIEVSGVPCPLTRVEIQKGWRIEVNYKARPRSSSSIEDQSPKCCPIFPSSFHPLAKFIKPDTPCRGIRRIN